MHSLNHPAADAVRLFSISEFDASRFTPALVGPHGRLAITILLDRPDETEAHGRRALVRSDQISWQGLLTLPAGQQFQSTILSGNVRMTRASPSVEFVSLFPSEPGLQPRAAIDWIDGPTGQFATPELGRHLPRPYLAFGRADEIPLLSAIVSAVAANPDRSAVRDRFWRAIARGLVLRATGPEVCLGRVDDPFDRPQYRLQSKIDGADRIVRLPDQFRVLVRPGQELEPDQPWACLPPRADCIPRTWSKRQFDFNRPRMEAHCGHPKTFRRLVWLWLSHQLIRLPSQPDQVLLPATLVGPNLRGIEPAGVWWDTAPFLPRYDWQTQSAVLPSLELVKPENPAAPMRIGPATPRIAVTR